MNAVYHTLISAQYVVCACFTFSLIADHGFGVWIGGIVLLETYFPV